MAKSRAIHTTTPNSGAFRGFGVPQTAIALETTLSELASAAGIDELDFRLLIVFEMVTQQLQDNRLKLGLA